MDAAERAAKIFIRRYEALNEEYLEIIGERVRAIGQGSSADMYQLRNIGADIDTLQRRLAAETGKGLKDLENLFEQAASAAMKPYNGLISAAPYMSNDIAKAISAAQYAETARAMVSLGNTTISSAAYQQLVDRAMSAVQLGPEGYQSAIRSVLRGAARDGLRVVDGMREVQYQSGLTRRLDTAARQNVLDGFRAVMQQTRDEAGKAFGADGVEISAHMLCAEDHLPYQGRQFSLEEFERLNETLRRPIAKGMWNCSHVAEPIMLGISKPAHTEEELAEYRRSSLEQVTIDGKTKSRYQWTQEQRRIETAIRREKDVAIAAKAAGDDVLRRECQQRIGDLRKRYDSISQAAGLEVRTDKMAVSGFGAVKVDENLTFIANDAKLKAASGLPKVLKGLPDEKLKGTAEVDFKIAQGIVPKGATVTSVCIIAGEGTSTPLRDLKRLYCSYTKLGKASGWQKKTGMVTTSNFRYEVHWYENNGKMPYGENKVKELKPK
ncbi:MAG: phage minor capsid protein [Candidatus Limiplasma sp.]|nr:phage minor capsid protein [Candidatus Limiplasma sp.]